MFDDLLETISNNNNNSNNSNNSNNNNGNNNENGSESENENDNDSESKSENDNENVNDNNNNNNNNNNNENQNENYDDFEIKKINDYFKMIDESISFEEQINLLKIMDDINRYWCTSYYDDDKELNLKIFKLKYPFLPNELDEKLFEEIFGHTFVTTNKEEKQIIINNI